VGRLLDAGAALTRNAIVMPDKIGVRDLERSLTFSEWNRRACRLANALAGLGLARGDRVAVLGYNCVEWMEIYAALSKAGLVAVPLNFRLVGREIRYILEDSGAAALIVQDALTGPIEEIRADLAIAPGRYVLFGGAARAGYLGYEALIERAADREPAADASADDTALLLYTSGTTGNPKGAMRSHRAEAVLSLICALGFGFTPSDTGLLVMPLCHANSLWFGQAITALGGTAVIYSRPSFDPELLLRLFAEERVSFASLVPTHYIMTLGLPAATLARYDVSGVRRLLISSAPARLDIKQAILEHFRNTGLFEAYGSTEGGWVTLLRPEEQFDKLGSIGRECPGTNAIRLLDEGGAPVPQGEVGELYFDTPAAFQGYWNLPDKTAAAFRDGWCTVGDMARRDADGYYQLADRRANLIISGGENVYPSEIENVLGAHPGIKDVAVVGLADATWGETVHAVVVPHPGASVEADELIAFARARLAGYKRPRSVSFIGEAEMPRTATGKIMHRVLRDRLGGGAGGR
jgi:acyl-CoA synthetase (AMP-forming)/AMP-acid ligase II